MRIWIFLLVLVVVLLCLIEVDAKKPAKADKAAKKNKNAKDAQEKKQPKDMAKEVVDKKRQKKNVADPEKLKKEVAVKKADQNAKKAKKPVEKAPKEKPVKKAKEPKPEKPKETKPVEKPKEAKPEVRKIQKPRLLIIKELQDSRDEGVYEIVEEEAVPQEQTSEAEESGAAVEPEPSVEEPQESEKLLPPSVLEEQVFIPELAKIKFIRKKPKKQQQQPCGQCGCGCPNCPRAARRRQNQPTRKSPSSGCPCPICGKQQTQTSASEKVLEQMKNDPDWMYFKLAPLDSLPEEGDPSANCPVFMIPRKQANEATKCLKVLKSEIESQEDQEGEPEGQAPLLKVEVGSKPAAKRSVKAPNQAESKSAASGKQSEVNQEPAKESDSGESGDLTEQESEEDRQGSEPAKEGTGKRPILEVNVN